MKYFSAQTVKTNDKKAENERRYRNILANSGLEMESGEIRDVENLYVMSRGGKLLRIGDLNANPDAQKEKYKVNFATNHGHNDEVTGERVVNVEDIIGDAKVWLDKDGMLNARVYFANNDPKADHAWAVSDNASYSIGTEWYPEGYYGAGLEIDEPIGILREISMVDTGNDPRAYTLDHKPALAQAQGSASTGDDGNQIENNKGESEMTEIKKDELTPDENRALKNVLSEVVDRFTTDAPESETEPTAREAKDEEGEAPAEAPAEKKDVLTSPVIVIRDKAVKQEMPVQKTVDKKAVVTKAIKAADGKFSVKFHDGIAGLADPLNIEKMFTDAIEKSDGIISYFRQANVRGLSNNVLNGVDDEGGRAKGFRKGDTKADQNLQNTIRTVYCKMVYKKLSLDSLEVYENPELIEFRARELVDAIILEIERAAIAGDGRTAPAEGQPDYRMFDGTNRGFFSIKADANATSGYGTFVASKYEIQEGENLYDAVVSARGLLMAGGEQILVADPALITAAFKAKVGSDYLIAPGASIEDTFRVARVFAPQWLNGTNEAYLIARNAYTMIGEGQIRTRADFDTSTNLDILLDETPRGGQLTAYKGAVMITAA
ncbi:hypothetical protein IJ098_00450 [Candidatus Saccharibacteria bacterium]|nr:hypothetical protein [Candidatus Saccharibacteria bacterium]